MIIKCDCHDEFQDEKYGKRMRNYIEKGVVHLNEYFVDGLKDERITEDDLPDSQFTCSVCGKQRYWWEKGGFKPYKKLFH